MSYDSVFVIGATGYIGGAVLHALLTNFPGKFKFTALVRNEKDFPALERLGVKCIKGSFETLDIIEHASAEADIVVNAANADALEIAQAVVKGMESRARAGKGPKPVLLHTSGTGVVADRANGAYTEYAKKEWNDASEEDIKSIDSFRPHRNVDLALFEAHSRGLISVHIIAPSTIVGAGDGPVRTLTQQVPYMVQTAVKNRTTYYVGPGTNVWRNVDIHDLEDLYVLVLKHALATAAEPNGSPYANFYFGSVNAHCWGDVARLIAPILYAKGLTDSPEAKSIELDKEPLLISTSINSVTKADRGLALGWKPMGRTLEEALQEDIDLTLAQL
ncbi:NADP-binding protein [Dacryopinax primogenitus]|uniref:NADP-binding protein n=1 Tax=Dacryopinax primogenitus (strain DJM 731) TaxID=1858805 RepID=M5G2B1_DACPD|nr:NADP-binding protein [Dacryopinax primogenitus]EJU04341.1 NADP-binding protein [Dacryopinax primogenitus]